MMEAIRMENIAGGLYNTLVSIDGDAKPIDLIRAGVEFLNPIPINKSYKKEILKGIIHKIAYGTENLPILKEDNNMIKHTLHILLVHMIENDVLDGLIDGVVALLKKKKTFIEKILKHFCIKF